MSQGLDGSPKPDAGMPPPASGTAAGRGINRGIYFSAVLLVTAIHLVRGALGPEHALALPLAVGGMVLSLMAVAGRLINIGLSAWFALCFIIPVVNFALGIACLALPPNYWQTRILDTIAIVVFGIFGLTLLAAAGSMVLA